MASSMQVSSREALRALAHPLRMKLLVHLEVAGHARAADLAQALGEPANSVSFHLRTLAKAGLIVEAPELARDKRDRVWRPAADRFDVAPGTPGTDALVRQYVAWFRAVITRRTANSDDDSSRVRVSQGYLTAQEAREFGAELGEVVERWSARIVAAREADPDTPREVYTIATAVGPSNLPAIDPTTDPTTDSGTDPGTDPGDPATGTAG